MRVPLFLEPVEPSRVGLRRGEPVTIGVPFPSGALRDAGIVRVRDRQGRAVALQTRTLLRWADGSIRWLLLDFRADTDAQAQATYWLDDETSADGVDAPATIQIEEAEERVTVATGEVHLTIDRSGHLVRAVHRGTDLLEDGVTLLVRGSAGSMCPLTVAAIAVEERGPLRACIRLNGTADTGGRRLDIIARLTCVAGSSTVQLRLTIRNPHRAEHRGGFWELGDAGSQLLRSVSVTTTLRDAGPVSIVASTDVGRDELHASVSLSVRQDSSGGEHWRSTAHVNRAGVVAVGPREGRIECDGHGADVRRPTPIVSVASGEGRVTMAMPEFWQNFPKAIDARGRTLSLHLFPEQPALHELLGGEQKTHEFWIDFGGDRVTERPLAWCLSPLIGRADPTWYANAAALPRLVPAGTDADGYRSLVEAGLDGDSSFVSKREAIDEYGWRHFGDIFADHESVGHTGLAPRVSHYNNQYDGVLGFGRWFLRTGDRRWWTLMRDLAHHVVDIDIYHTQEDRAAYNGGCFWHTAHYVDAGRSTHRAHPRNTPGVHGGGPSPENTYAQGLLLYHLMTGDEAAREAVRGLGEWVLAADDGRRSRFRWLATGATGLASASGSFDYHGPGRCGANSIGVMLDCDTLWDDARFMAKAEALIRRCVHPEQDIDSLNLLDAERRWFYTMFLQAVGRYLDRKQERGEADAMAAYARESLLHFARWMATHEHPYLERPAILEYPNETWAAQDMRKAEVFLLAALHASGDERAMFIGRARFFFDASVRTLQAWPTRTLARPMVLLLNNGPSVAWLDTHAARQDIAEPSRAPSRPSAFTPFVPFVPQKVRAVRNAKILAVTGVVATVVVLAFTAYRLWSLS